MKRILVADDERPVIESISLIVKRELAAEFELAGHAMSGREAIDKAAALAPDIILMDVRMPGISGLDAIREIRKRGSAAAFILVTAYERFDIAREAVALGVNDYLLKPVSKDKLAAALRNAADSIERRGEAERREIEHREREETMRSFVESALLHGIMLGERFGAELAKYSAVLEINDPIAVVAAMAFLPPPGSPDPDLDMAALHEKLRATVRYKTRAFAGPLVAGHSVILLPVRDEVSAAEAMESLRKVLVQAHGEAFEKGFLRIGLGTPKPLALARLSWAEAMSDVLGGKRTVSRVPLEERPFENDEQFLEAIVNGAPERARHALERMLLQVHASAVPAIQDRYRLIALLGSAGRMLARKGLIPPEAVMGMMNFEDLRTAADSPALELALRARLASLVDLIGRSPQWSPLIARAIAYVQENFGKQMSLETTAYSLGISPNRLSRLFSEETGKGFSDYLIEFRIEKAKELLLLPGASIKQVSISCGYPDPNYFSRLFKKVTGLTPTIFSSGISEANDGNS